MDLTSPSVADGPSLDAQFKKAKKALGNIPTLRNKILCHNDCALGNKNISESLQTIKTSLDEVKILFQMCCGAAHHRFAPNTNSVRALKNLIRRCHPASQKAQTWGFAKSPGEPTEAITPIENPQSTHKSV
jgi:hypothetical protein